MSSTSERSKPYQHLSANTTEAITLFLDIKLVDPSPESEQTSKNIP